MFLNKKLFHGYNALLGFLSEMDEIVGSDQFTDSEKVELVKVKLKEAAKPSDDRKVVANNAKINRDVL